MFCLFTFSCLKHWEPIVNKEQPPTERDVVNVPHQLRSSIGASGHSLVVGRRSVNRNVAGSTGLDFSFSETFRSPNQKRSSPIHPIYWAKRKKTNSLKSKSRLYMIYTMCINRYEPKQKQSKDKKKKTKVIVDIILMQEMSPRDRLVEQPICISFNLWLVRWQN